MNETAVRAALRDATDGVGPYDVLGRALSGARRRRLARLVAAPVVLFLVGALAVVGWSSIPEVTERSAQPHQAPAGVPDRLDDPRSRVPTVTARPPGPVAAAYTGEKYASLTGRLGVVLSGPAGYRVTDRVERGAARPGESVLLSPAGDRLAYLDSDSGVVVLDLTTGRRATVPGSDRRMEPLAWSPDNRTLAVATAPEPGADGRKMWRGLGLLDTGAGGFRTVAGPAGWYTPGFAVAFAPDGAKLAYQNDTRIVVVGVDGAGVAELVVSDGGLLAGKGAFTPDGASVAVSVGSGCCLRHLAIYRLVPPTEGAPEPRRTAEVGDTSALRVQGWTPDGRAVAVAFRPLSYYEDSPYKSGPPSVQTRADRVRRVEVVTVGADFGSILLASSSHVQALDLAERTVATGQVVSAPPPPRGLPPPFPLAWRDLPTVFGWLSGLVFLIGAAVAAVWAVERRITASEGEPR